MRRDAGPAGASETNAFQQTVLRQLRKTATEGPAGTMGRPEGGESARCPGTAEETLRWLVEEKLEQKLEEVTEEKLEILVQGRLDKLVE
eukprot:COSAG06_NODE_62093_length_266_cov_0.586826_1_plen_88_part_11